MQLFRQQAIDHQHRLYGEVLLVRPLPWQAIAWLVMALLVSSMLFLTFGTHSRTIAASGTVDHDGRIVLSVPASAIAEVASGQSVRFMLDASHSPKEGMFLGVVDHVSTTSDRQRQADVQVVARVGPHPRQQRASSATLHPGQTLNARIIVGQQSLFHWITGTRDAVARP